MADVALAVAIYLLMDNRKFFDKILISMSASGKVGSLSVGAWNEG